jgi:hypothetical protein
MTTKSRRKAPAKITTLKKVAALDFEPWQVDADFKVPTLEEIANPHLILCRLAYALMHKSKPELVQSFADGTTTILPLIGRLEESRRFFMGAAQLLELGRARLIVAGSCVTEAAR